MTTTQEINIERLIQHEPAEVRKFVRVAADWIYTVIISYVHRKEDAEEISQDTILAALKSLGSFKNQATLKTWVYSIAINKSKDFLKYSTRQRRHGTVISLTEDQNQRIPEKAIDYNHPGVHLESQEQMDALFEAINALPENQKTALILAKLDQRSQKEIALIMDISIKAVESLLSRAKKNLRSELEKIGIVVKAKKKMS